MPGILSNLCPQAELEALLSETVASAQQRERSYFDELAAPFANRIVIYGAGNLGRRTLRGISTSGVEVVAFADADPAKWGHPIEGIPVLSPESAAEHFAKEALFVVAVWRPASRGGIADIGLHLGRLGCQATSFVPLSWKHADKLLPYYLWDLPSNLLAGAPRVWSAYQLFSADRQSAIEYVRQIRLRLSADFAALSPPVAEPAYFPDLFHPIPDESFVDCGAFDGDTIAAFERWTGGRFRRIAAFEADPGNWKVLQAALGQRADLAGRVVAVPQAVAERSGSIRFNASGSSDAAISADGTIEVECCTLDEILRADRVTFIKMDIEGAEESAIRGALTVIGRDRPILAICVYHRQDHIWNIPLLIRSVFDEAHFALRSYCVDAMETVCYAVPPARAHFPGGGPGAATSPSGTPR